MKFPHILWDLLHSCFRRRSSWSEFQTFLSSLNSSLTTAVKQVRTLMTAMKQVRTLMTAVKLVRTLTTAVKLVRTLTTAVKQVRSILMNALSWQWFHSSCYFTSNFTRFTDNNFVPIATGSILTNTLTLPMTLLIKEMLVPNSWHWFYQQFTKLAKCS